MPMAAKPAPSSWKKRFQEKSLKITWSKIANPKTGVKINICGLIKIPNANTK